MSHSEISDFKYEDEPLACNEGLTQFFSDLDNKKNMLSEEPAFFFDDILSPISPITQAPSSPDVDSETDTLSAIEEPSDSPMEDVTMSVTDEEPAPPQQSILSLMMQSNKEVVTHTAPETKVVASQKNKVKIIVKDRVYNINKEYMRTRLSSFPNKDTVIIDNCEPRVFETFLEIIKSRSVPIPKTIHVTTFEEVMALCYKYYNKSLIKRCATWLLNHRESFRALVIADKYNMKDIIDPLIQKLVGRSDYLRNPRILELSKELILRLFRANMDHLNDTESDEEESPKKKRKLSKFRDEAYKE